MLEQLFLIHTFCITISVYQLMDKMLLCYLLYYFVIKDVLVE